MQDSANIEARTDCRTMSQAAGQHCCCMTCSSSSSSSVLAAEVAAAGRTAASTVQQQRAGLRLLLFSNWTGLRTQHVGTAAVDHCKDCTGFLQHEEFARLSQSPASSAASHALRERQWHCCVQIIRSSSSNSSSKAFSYSRMYHAPIWVLQNLRAIPLTCNVRSATSFTHGQCRVSGGYLHTSNSASNRI
eukprot:14436-Heterococcus_DN1.PRE.2